MGRPGSTAAPNVPENSPLPRQHRKTTVVENWQQHHNHQALVSKHKRQANERAPKLCLHRSLCSRPCQAWSPEAVARQVQLRSRCRSGPHPVRILAQVLNACNTATQSISHHILSSPIEEAREVRATQAAARAAISREAQDPGLDPDRKRKR